MAWRRTMLNAASSMGVESLAIDAYDRLGSGPPDFDVDPEIRRFDPPANEGNQESVLLPVTQGQDPLLSYAYCILAHAFRVRGFRPVLPLCNQDLNLCIRKENSPDDAATCAICHRFGKALFASFGLEPTAISDILPANHPDFEQSDYENVTTYRGVDVSDYAKATARRYMKKRIVNLDEGSERDIFDRMRTSAIKLVDCAYELLSDGSSVAVVAFHPMYMYGGVYLEVAKQLGVPAVSASLGYNNRRIMFGDLSNRCALPEYTDSDTVMQYVSTPLSKDEREEIDELMYRRMYGDGSDVRIHMASDTTGSIEDPAGCDMIGVFTNVMWDASLEAENLIFSNAYSWVSTTIEYLSQESDTLVVVKPHPAEVRRETKNGMADWLRANFDPLPANIRLLEADTNVNPYKLMNQIDVGVVFNSTMGLEMAYEGVPVIVANDTHYRGAGLTYDPTSIDEYLELLSKRNELSVSPEMRERARRYAHLLFVKKQIDFPFYTQGVNGFELLPVKHDEIVEGNENFDTIVQKIVTGNTVLRS